MRAPLASLIALSCWLALALPGSALDSDTLKGNVTKDDAATRVARPKIEVLNGGADSGAGRSRSTLNTSVQAGAFDLDAQRRRMPAGITEGMLNGWIQSPLSRQDGEEDPRLWQRHMDEFFAFGHLNRVVNRTGSMVAGPPGLHVFVRMGLCGSWDAGGDGHLRWARLNQELHSPNLGPAWSEWQRTVSDLVQQRMESLPDVGAASMHVAVNYRGGLESVTDYRQGERPMSYLGTNESLALQLQAALYGMAALPPFPSGSQSPNAHILIFVTHY